MTPKKPLTGWAVDGATSGNPGPSQYKCIDIATGKTVFSHNNIGHATNNITEFIAVVHAIGEAIKQDKDVFIYTDSMVAFSWLKNKKVNTKMEITSETGKAWEKAKQCIDYLNNQKFDNLGAGIVRLNRIHVCMWITKEWGENPADFGNKN